MTRGWVLKRWELTLAALLGAIWSTFAILRHHAGHSSAFDLGLFTNVLWNLTHGGGYISSIKGGINLFADHQSPILWTFAPFFALFPRAETLLILQSCALASAVIPLVRYVRRKFPHQKEFYAGIAALLFTLSQPVRAANLFDFHPEVLYLPLMLWALERLTLATRLATAQAAALGIFALGCKESAGFSVALACVGLILGLEGAPARRLGRLGFAVAILWLGLCVWVIPRYFGVGYAYGDQYALWFANPLKAVARSFELVRLSFVFKLLVSAGFLPLFGRQAFARSLIGLGATLPILTAADPARANPHFHYGIEATFAFFWALPWGLEWLRAHGVNRSARVAIPILLALTRVGTWDLGQARTWAAAASQTRWMRTEVLPLLDPAASVAASDGWVAHVATRNQVFRITDALTEPASIAAAIDRPQCALFDLGARQWPLTPQESAGAPARLRAVGYLLSWSCRGVLLFALPGEKCWIAAVPDCPQASH